MDATEFKLITRIIILTFSSILCKFKISSNDYHFFLFFIILGKYRKRTKHAIFSIASRGIKQYEQNI